MNKEIKHTYGQNTSGNNGKPGNPAVTQNPSNDGTITGRQDEKTDTHKNDMEDNEIQENKSSKEQKNRVRK